MNDTLVRPSERAEVENVEDRALVVDAVTRRFGDLLAVNHLSFHVDGGTIFGVLGPNGAGKTTTINMVTGMLRPDSGHVRILGIDPLVGKREVRRKIGLVPQETNAYFDLTPLDNLWHHAALYCDDMNAAESNIERLLVMMKLWERRRDAVRTFSGGMKRRLVLARALLHDPEIILFDEPTVGVDVQGKHDLWQHIREQRDLGKTFIISTNDMAEAEALCDRLIIIDHGRAIAIGTPDELKSEIRHDIVTLVTSPPIVDPARLFDGLGVRSVSVGEDHALRLELNQAEQVVGELVQRTTRDHQLDSIHIARPTLDDVFLYHTGRALRE